MAVPSPSSATTGRSEHDVLDAPSTCATSIAAEQIASTLGILA